MAGPLPARVALTGVVLYWTSQLSKMTRPRRASEVDNLKIVLTAVDVPLAEAWQRWCGDLRCVEVHQGSIFDAACDAVVSPANSFGFMDGGIDRLYTEFFGPAVQVRVQACIRGCHDGELLVGQADIVPTGHDRIPFLIAAPTMRVPTALGRSIHPYLAARAVLLLVLRGQFSCGELAGQPIAARVGRIAFSGLGTGVGRVQPVTCAKQVRAAIEDFVLGRFEFPDSTLQARKRHDRLVGE
jgi:O-acetyl-ADP-ribose deacetylase (regulator of RNase III)